MPDPATGLPTYEELAARRAARLQGGASGPTAAPSLNGVTAAPQSAAQPPTPLTPPPSTSQQPPSGVPSYAELAARRQARLGGQPRLNSGNVPASYTQAMMGPDIGGFGAPQPGPAAPRSRYEAAHARMLARQGQTDPSRGIDPMTGEGLPELRKPLMGAGGSWAPEQPLGIGESVKAAFLGAPTLAERFLPGILGLAPGGAAAAAFHGQDARPGAINPLRDVRERAAATPEGQRLTAGTPGLPGSLVAGGARVAADLPFMLAAGTAAPEAGAWNAMVHPAVSMGLPELGASTGEGDPLGGLARGAGQAVTGAAMGGGSQLAEGIAPGVLARILGGTGGMLGSEAAQQGRAPTPSEALQALLMTGAFEAPGALGRAAKTDARSAAEPPPTMGHGAVSPAQAEAVGQRAMNRRAADQIDGLAALPPDEAAQFKARLRVEGSTPQARQQILADAHDANAAWERVGGSQEVAPQPERHYTPEEQAAGDAALEAAGYSGPERRATVRPEPSPEAIAMSQRLPAEADVPGNLGPQGEMGGRTLVNEPGGSTRAAEPPPPGGRSEAPAPRTLTPEEQAFRMSAKLAPDRRALFPRASEVPPVVRDATLDTAIEGVGRQQRAAMPDVYDTQPLRPGEAAASARRPGPYDTQPVPHQPAAPPETALTRTGRGARQSESLPPPRRHATPKAFWDNATAAERAAALGVDPATTRVHRGRWADLTPEAQAAVGKHLNPPPLPPPPPPPGTALAHGASGGKGGPPIRRLFEPDDISHPPGPPGPPSPTVNEFFGRTANAPSKATTLLPRIIDQLKETFVTSHKLRGEHPVYDPRLGDVPATKSFADARNRIRLLADVARHASTATIEALKPVVEGLNHKQLDILRRKVFIEDLLETSRRGEATPLTAADLAAEKARLDPIVAADPLLTRAFRRDQELWQAAGADLVKRGKLDAANLRAHYVHHEVMDYISQKGAGFGKPYSLRNVSRRYLRRRLGSSKDIYTNYLDVRYRSLAKHVRDNMIDDAVTEIANRYGVPAADAARLGYVPFSVEELWQVAGKTSHDQTILRFVRDISRDLDPGIARAAFGDIEQRLLKRKTFIHPDLAATLTHLRDIYQEPGILAKATGHWKQAMLNKNPPRYNFNNMIGDAERGWNALPEMFRDGGRERMGRVLRDLKAAARGEFSSDYRLAQQHSVVDSGEIYHEIGAIKEAEAFKHLDPNDRGSWRHPLTYVSGKLRDASTTRENLLRLQAFYTNLDRMRAGKPLAAGVSDIRGLSDPVAAAAKISREALGDYGDFTPREVKARRVLLPFYSWLKINTTFWPTLFARRGAGAGAKAAARIAPRAVLKSGLAIAKATAIYAAASAFNNSVQQEQEESLPEDVRRKFHVNTGLHDAKGRWVTITEPTALSDFMDGIGTEGITTDVAELLRGQLSAHDFAANLGGRTAAPLRKVASRVTPAITGPVEAVTGRRFYPDPLNPSPSAEHNPLTRLASGMGFGEFTSPQQTLDTYKRSLGELGAIGIRRYDAGLSALRNTEERVRAFRSAKGYIDDAPSEGPLTAVNRALLYALADKNYTRAAAILRKTSPKAFSAYLGARDPIVRIPVKFRKEFAATLSAHDREQIARAKAFLGATGGSLRQAVAPAAR